MNLNKVKRCISRKLKKILCYVKKNSILERYNNPVGIELTESVARNRIKEVYTPRDIIWGIAKSDYTDYMDVSIIVPVFNGEKYLKECINSLVNQKTNYKYEIICVNDGSVDTSKNILEMYINHENIKTIHQDNHGISYTRNIGVKNAKGKYIVFVDNDDYLSENFVQNMMQKAEENNADIVKCGYRVFNKERDYFKDYHETETRIYTNGLQKDILTYTGFVWGTLIDRKLFDQISFPDGYWYEDMITRLLLFKCCKRFVYLDEINYFYRVHGGNASIKVWNKKAYKSMDQFFLLEKIDQHLTECGIKLDNWTYKIYLSELGIFLYERTLDLELEMRESIFVLAAAFIRKYYLSSYKSDFLEEREKMLQRAFYKNDFLLWENVCKYFY